MDVATMIGIMQLLRDVYHGVDIVIGTFTDEEDGTPYIGWGEDMDGDGELSPFEVLHKFVQPEEQETEKAIILVSPDGGMTVYDPNGEITAEDCDTAYSLWVADNGIMSKPLDNYTVTEGLLLIAGIVACFGFVAKLFRRRKVM